MACARRAGLASVKRTFSIIQLSPQQWSSASPYWPQNLDSTALKRFENSKSCLPFHGFVLGHKFYSTEASATLQFREETKSTSDVDENPELQGVNSKEEKDTGPESNKTDEGPDKKKGELTAAEREICPVLENSEEEEDTWPELNKTDEVSDKMKRDLVAARREICQILEKGDEDMEEDLSQLGVQINPRLVNTALDKTSSPSMALRFFQWAKVQPTFKHNSSYYDKLVNAFGRCKDFKTLQMILAEMLSVRCDCSVKTFSFATAWHDDPDMLNEVMEMFKKLALSFRRNGYEMLIAALCEENHINAALVVLEKMASAGCTPRMLTYRPLIQVYCQNNQMDKVQEVFEITKDSPQDSICYNVVLSALCRRKQFQEATQLLQTRVNRGCKPEANTYHILIRAACNIGKIQGALKLFDRMKEEGIKPSFATYCYLLHELFQTRGYDGAHAFLIQQSGEDNRIEMGNYNYLIRVCLKSGKHEHARNLLLEKKVKGFRASG